MCMANNCKNNKHTRHISRIMQFVINDEELNLHNTVWCEIVLKLSGIENRNVMEYELNHIIEYSMVRL